MAKSPFSIKGITLASAITWGSGVFFVGLINMFHTGYGTQFLILVSSVYPGYHAEPNFASVLIGTAYALLDGAIASFIFAWIYNRFE